jgi:hypothetical protein
VKLRSRVALVLRAACGVDWGIEAHAMGVGAACGAATGSELLAIEEG